MFPDHSGFDFAEIGVALGDGLAGGRLRGASTISQQVAKNLFLWPGRSVARKSIEAWLTVWIEWLWPKHRILEMYLNVDEFGLFEAIPARDETQLFPRVDPVLNGVVVLVHRAASQQPEHLLLQPERADQLGGA